MTKYLVFRLYGPMASWGDVAVGTYRPTFDHPSKSAVMGLLAAAIGIRRDEEVKLRKMAESYDFAVRVDASGTMLRDYHTSQVPPSGTGRRDIQLKDSLSWINDRTIFFINVMHMLLSPCRKRYTNVRHGNMCF